MRIVDLSQLQIDLKYLVMKRIFSKAKWPWLIGSSLAAITCTSLLVVAKSPTPYTAHEWGTFTSVQGGDGNLLSWKPLESSDLPGFVYNWGNPGLKRSLGPGMALRKDAMHGLQRMETPVIYFYSDQEQTVDVTVKFPKGLITEWYPQASQIGPSTMPQVPAIAKLDEYAQKAGANRGFTFASLFGRRDIEESLARWASVRILPKSRHSDVGRSLPSDRSGSHYFAARETGADYLRISSLVETNPAPEHEKFIFYRGVGSFTTPIVVRCEAGGSLVVSNSDLAPVLHLFVLKVANGRGSFQPLPRLSAREAQRIHLGTKPEMPLPALSADLAAQIIAALVQEGLYEQEAIAMVKTWNDSWFTEEGVRVLYLLPRAWTDLTLPLKMDPPPREVVRVMVGRAEVITPEQQQQLSQALAKAAQGDSEAHQEVLATFKKLGRFAEPAWRLAVRDATPEQSQKAWTLWQQAAKASTQEKAL